MIMNYDSPFLFQASMDLPPDKAKLLKQYDNEKKWDIICDQVSALINLPSFFKESLFLIN